MKSHQVAVASRWRSSGVPSAKAMRGLLGGPQETKPAPTRTQAIAAVIGLTSASLSWQDFYRTSAPPRTGSDSARSGVGVSVGPARRTIEGPHPAPEASRREGSGSHLLSMPLEPIELLLCSLNQVVETRFR